MLSQNGRYIYNYIHADIESSANIRVGFKPIGIGIGYHDRYQRFYSPTQLFDVPLDPPLDIRNKFKLI